MKIFISKELVEDEREIYQKLRHIAFSERDKYNTRKRSHKKIITGGRIDLKMK